MTSRTYLPCPFCESPAEEGKHRKGTTYDAHYVRCSNFNCELHRWIRDSRWEARPVERKLKNLVNSCVDVIKYYGAGNGLVNLVDGSHVDSEYFEKDDRYYTGMVARSFLFQLNKPAKAKEEDEHQEGVCWS